MKKSLFSAFAVGLCMTASIWAQVPTYVPTNGLVGWWPFNANANDESGNGNNGTVNGATLTTDRFGVANKAFSFDGSDFITLQPNTNIQGNNPRSISSWFKLNNLSSNTHTLYKGGENGEANDFSIWLICNNNQVRFQIRRYTNDIVTNNFNVSLNQWHSLIISYDGTNDLQTKIYLDNQLISTFQVAPSGIAYNTSTTTPRFGMLTDQEGVSHYFNGLIDDIGIWNRALSECEIQDLYNSQINSLAGSISVSPNPASIGANVALSSASNSTNVQWQSNPSNFGWQNVPANSTYSGINTNNLVVNNIQLANHNQPFRVIASSGNCTDTSNIATIQIADTCITNVTVYDTLYTTVTDTLLINTTLSLPAPNNENTILIYPNPASDHITIDNGNFAAMAGYSIKIENNAGQQVFQSAINQAQFYVDMSTWTGNGLYFVHLIDPQNNTVTVRKIVLQ
jgi:hypothetical protein